MLGAVHNACGMDTNSLGTLSLNVRHDQTRKTSSRKQPPSEAASDVRRRKHSACDAYRYK